MAKNELEKATKGEVLEKAKKIIKIIGEDEVEASKIIKILIASFGIPKDCINF